MTVVIRFMTVVIMLMTVVIMLHDGGHHAS